MRLDVSADERIRDSSAWFAAANVKDRNNAAAKQLLARSTDLITTDHVLIESWLVMRRQIHRRAPEAYWEGIRNGLAVVEKVEPGDIDAAWAIGRTFPDQDFSIVDRTRFAVMERLGCKLRQRFRDLSLRPQPGSGVRDTALTRHRLRSRQAPQSALVNRARSG